MLKVVPSIEDKMHEEANLFVNILLSAAELVDAKDITKYDS